MHTNAPFVLKIQPQTIPMHLNCGYFSLFEKWICFCTFLFAVLFFHLPQKGKWIEYAYKLHEFQFIWFCFFVFSLLSCGQYFHLDSIATNKNVKSQQTINEIVLFVDYFIRQ